MRTAAVIVTPASGRSFSTLGPRTSNLDPRPSTLEPRTSTLDARTSTLDPRTSNLGSKPINSAVVASAVRWKILIALLIIAGAPSTWAQDQTPQAVQPPAAGPETIAEIRVHGNATIADDEVIRLSGVTIGATLEPDGLQSIERRLRDSGRFDDIQVRKRYRTLAMDEVAIVLLVHERPGVRPDGTLPSPIHRFTSRLMFLPILTYDDGYGWTYGGRTSLVDSLGLGERLSVPLTWGATKRAALEAERTFRGGPLTRVQGSFGIAQRENPHFELDDTRTELRGRVERRLKGILTLGADAGRTSLDFGGAPSDFWTGGVDAALDTRRDPAFPSDAVYFGAGWNQLHVQGSSGVNRYRLDGRGYKRLIGQSVIAVRAQYDTADAPLPPYEQWLLGGSFLRGTPAGTFAGEKRFVASAELRVPFSSPLSTGRVGFTAFMDGGISAAYGQDITKLPLSRGAGAGLFLIIPFISLNFDVAHSLDGYGTRVHFSTGFTF
jgi:outer membrane protein assembly factor BamA